MTSPMFSLVCVLLVLIHQADGSLRLEVYPTDVTQGLTETLTVNCSFTFAGITNMSGIIALIVSKSEVNGSQFEDLVSVNAFKPDELTILRPGLDGIVSGQIDTDGESFLSIVWTYPTSNQTGQYRCETNGMDNSGHPIEMFQTMQVILQQSSLDQLTAKVSQLQRQLETQENLAKNQSDEINKLTTLAKNQSSEIDQLLSLTKTQSEMISSQQLQLDSMESKFGLVIPLLPFHFSTEYIGHHYLLSKQDYNDATEAAKTCKNYGGYLAQINDASENQFVKDFLDQLTGFDNVLVSGIDENLDGHWTFSGTDSDIVFFDWQPGHPKTSQSSNCIALSIFHQWQWWTCECTADFSRFKFLCELESL